MTSNMGRPRSRPARIRRTGSVAGRMLLCQNARCHSEGSLNQKQGVLGAKIVVWTTIVPTTIIVGMTTSDRRRVRAHRFDSPEQEAFLALWRTYDRLRVHEDELFAGFDLTPQQYNVLRLLRAAHPEPAPTLKLLDRLVSRAPDVTRMLDKLEARGLISRTRSLTDRRAVLVGITESGLALVRQI